MNSSFFRSEVSRSCFHTIPSKDYSASECTFPRYKTRCTRGILGRGRVALVANWLISIALQQPSASGQRLGPKSQLLSSHISLGMNNDNGMASIMWAPQRANDAQRKREGNSRDKREWWNIHGILAGQPMRIVKYVISVRRSAAMMESTCNIPRWEGAGTIALSENSLLVRRGRRGRSCFTIVCGIKGFQPMEV